MEELARKRRKMNTKKYRASVAPTIENKAGSDASPRSWWRTMRAEDFDASTAIALRQSVAAVALLDEPSWHRATSGDAAAAIGLALRLDPDRATDMTYDLVMTVLAACAAENNPAACLAMSHVMRRRLGKSASRLATSWLVRAFRKLLDRDERVGKQP
jgi:hypothetical protein